MEGSQIETHEKHTPYPLSTAALLARARVAGGLAVYNHTVANVELACGDTRAAAARILNAVEMRIIERDCVQAVAESPDGRTAAEIATQTVDNRTSVERANQLVNRWGLNRGEEPRCVGPRVAI